MAAACRMPHHGNGSMEKTKMQAELADLMNELREDHRNMAIVLDIVDGVIDSIRAEDDSVLELLAEIMHFMTVFPDAVHHPKEDLVYEQLQELRPDLANGLEDVPGDHADIADLGLRLKADIDAIESGSTVKREQLISDAASYVERLRNHMAWEESDLFERVDRMLGSKKHPVDLSRFHELHDPVFGESSAAGFQRLMESLKANAA